MSQFIQNEINKQTQIKMTQNMSKDKIRVDSYSDESIAIVTSW